MNEPSASELDELRETLGAYLDRELTTEERRSVEERLARDERAREELQRLQRVNDALDALPRATPDETFTRSTLEMVAVAVESDLASESDVASPSRRTWLLGLAGVAAAAVAAFGLSLALAPDPNGPLLRDLEVIENFDAYEAVGDLDYLRELDQTGLFEPNPDNKAVAGKRA